MAWPLLSGVEYPCVFCSCARMRGAKYSTQGVCPAVLAGEGHVAGSVSVPHDPAGRRLLGSAVAVRCSSRCLLPRFCRVVLLFLWTYLVGTESCTRDA